MRPALPVSVTAALLFAGLVWVSPAAWAEGWQDDSRRRHARVEEGARGPGAPLGRRPRGASAPAARAKFSAWDLVWRSEAASQQVSLRGRARTTAQFGPRLESATAKIVAARGKMRLDYESGSKRWSLLDDGRHLIRVRPGPDPPAILPRPAFVTDKALAERNYAARFMGEEQVAGRPTQIVEIVSRASGASTWRLWLDRETFFALKRERYNADSKLMTSTEYLAVEFGGSVPEAEFSVAGDRRPAATPGPEKSLSPEALEKVMGFSVRPPRYLPPGYVLQGGYARREGKGGGPGHRRGALTTSAELRYTDGIRLLSVSQWEATGDKARPVPPPSREQSRKRWRGGREREETRGREGVRLMDHGSERVLRYHGSDRVVVVIGDLPEDDLARIAQSVAGN